MFSNYLLIALRNIRKHFSYSIINIAGLGLGLATCLLLTVWIRHELSYDSFHTNIDRLYRVALEYSFGGQTSKTAQSPTALLPALQKNFAEVEQGVRFYNAASFRPYVVKKGDALFEENRFYFADSTFFQVLSFRLLKGDPRTALSEPNTLVISSSMAAKYFGDEDPMGKQMFINNRADYTVTGIMEDVPSNSMLKLDFVASFISIPAGREAPIWWSANYQTYVVLSPHADLSVIQEKTNALVGEELKSELGGPGDYVKYNFTPVKDMYLRSDVQEPQVVGSIQYVYIFSVIAGLILVIACINYINLATARAAYRAKEVGVRKVVGAIRKQLFVQFVGESVIITMLAFVVAILLASLALPIFNELTGKFFNIWTILNPLFILPALVVLLGIAVLSGVYPAVVITGFKLVSILRGNFRSSGKGVWLRQSLVVFQFCISIVLVIGTIVIMNQLEFIRNRNIGYHKDNVIMLPMDRKTAEVYTGLRTEMVKSGHVVEMARASESPVHVQGGYSINVPGANERGMITRAIPVDNGFVPTFGMEFVAGENFSESDFERLLKDTVHSFILNEAAVRELFTDNESAVGTTVRMNGRVGPIKGVLKDFHFTSMHEQIGPLVLFTDINEINWFFARLAPGDPTTALADLREIYNRLVPHRPFEYSFVSQRFEALYTGEQRMGSVGSVFAILAIIIACLGLLGLVSFAASQKTKEIGIRKVMGATAPGIVLLITRDFTRLVTLSIAIAVPVSWYLMENYWLSDFAYRTSIGVAPFLIAAAGCLAIAFGTAGYQAVKAAMVNPANTLRNE